MSDPGLFDLQAFVKPTWAIARDGETWIVEAESIEEAVAMWRQWCARELGAIEESGQPDSVQRVHTNGLIVRRPK